MNINDIKKVYFLGIGGIGMSALARYFNTHGCKVYGYDKTPTLLTSELENEGISITFEDSIDTLLKDADIVVFTPAIPKNSIQYQYYVSNNYSLHKRAEILGLIANSMYNICIAGSHGKTSTSSITSFILKTAQLDVAAFLGGVCANYQSNYLDGSTFAVAEADEFDRSFLQLNPNICLITSIDTDHLDIYGTFEAIVESFTDFTNNLREDGVLILHHTNVPKNVVQRKAKIFTYALDNNEADYNVSNLRVINGANWFDINHPKGTIKDVVCNYAGKHNVENALGASAIALQLNISEEYIKKALLEFKGIRRRFETHISNEKIVYIDDYAHHPRELDACIQSAKSLYPNKKITAIFQPHLYSRTRDLASEFALALENVDTPILLEIYPARELPIEGVSSQLIFEKIKNPNKILIPKNKILEVINDLEIELLLTVGAGDIDTFVDKIKNKLTKK
jgi:UDP-N-acetylmuramate--alanine ligase